ncbi:MAG: molybdopterin-guanine dinucleotide biosynthesis protein MobB [Aminivibrio sp.]|jgi:molybdopterin-guanine dinucleotide biosynthesis protein B
MPILIAVSGFKDRGKTTLAHALIAEIIAGGLSAAFIKHTNRPVLPVGATDTSRISALGVPSLYWGRDGYAIEAPVGEFSRKFVAGLFPGKDVVIVEGAKHIPMPRIWVGPPDSLPPEVRGVFAFYDRSAHSGDGGGRIFSPGQEKALAEKIMGLYDRVAEDQPSSLYVRGEKIPLKGFVSGMIAGCLAGLILPLKRVDSLRGGAEIFLRRRK